MAANKTVRVKVGTSQLLEAVRTRRNKMVTDHERALDNYDVKLASYNSRVIKALQKAIVDVEGGKVLDSGYRGVNVPVNGSAPSKPSLHTQEINRLIATLEMAAEPVITISSDDAARYLG